MPQKGNKPEEIIGKLRESMSKVALRGRKKIKNQ